INRTTCLCSRNPVLASRWATLPTRSRQRLPPLPIPIARKALPRRWRIASSTPWYRVHNEPSAGRVYTLPDLPALARHLAGWVTAAVSAANGPFRISLSGGSTPKRCYSLLASPEFRTLSPGGLSNDTGAVDVSSLTTIQGNYGMVPEAMLAKAPVARKNIH